MITDPTPPAADEAGASLERRANAVRARLLQTVTALDVRRHKVGEIGDTAKKLAIPAALTILGAVALVSASALAVSVVIGRRRRHWLSDGVARVIDRLELARRPSLGWLLLEKAALAAVSIAAAEVARVSTKNLLDGRRPDGRLLR